MQEKPGSYVHRFSWFKDELIGEHAVEWNWLATKYDNTGKAKNIYYTLGSPCFSKYKILLWRNTSK